jgi:hypothetical protein
MIPKKLYLKSVAFVNDILLSAGHNNRKRLSCCVCCHSGRYSTRKPCFLQQIELEWLQKQKFGFYCRGSLKMARVFATYQRGGRSTAVILESGVDEATLVQGSVFKAKATQVGGHLFKGLLNNPRSFLVLALPQEEGQGLYLSAP